MILTFPLFIALFLSIIISLSFASEEYSNQVDKVKFPEISDEKRAERLGLLNDKPATLSLLTFRTARKFPAARGDRIYNMKIYEQVSAAADTKPPATTTSTPATSTMAIENIFDFGQAEQVLEPVLQISSLPVNVKISSGNHSNSVQVFAEKVNLNYPRKSFDIAAATKGDPFRDVKDFLEKSAIADINFTSAPKDKEKTLTVNKRKTRSTSIIDQDGNLIRGYLGEFWCKTDWEDTSDSDEERHARIREALAESSPKTITNIPSLAPKKVWERDVLEGWLIEGLKAAYPTAHSLNLSKNDAIAMILIAILSRKIENDKIQQVIHKIINELGKYVGPNPAAETAFPIETFTGTVAIDDNFELLKKTFRIVEELDLKYSAQVIRQITQH